MRPRYLGYTVLVVSLAAIFLAGCSVRTIPLEEETIVYEDAYYRGYDRLPPSLLYDAWQLSQYRHYYGATSALGYPLPYRMNIDPNPHDSYRADEQPVQRAPAHTSVQGTANRRVGEHRDQTEFQRRVNRSRHTRSNRLTADSTEDRSRLRKQLRQRHRQRRTDTADDEDRKAQRRTTRRRARR